MMIADAHLRIRYHHISRRKKDQGLNPAAETCIRASTAEPA